MFNIAAFKENFEVNDGELKTEKVELCGAHDRQEDLSYAKSLID